MDADTVKAWSGAGIGAMLASGMIWLGGKFLDNQHEQDMADKAAEIKVIEALEINAAAATSHAASSVRMAESFEELTETYTGK